MRLSYKSIAEEGNIEKCERDFSLIRQSENSVWKLIYVQIGNVVSKPRKYNIHVIHRGKGVYIGEVNFWYNKPEPYTVEQFRAIEADPYSTKGIRAKLSCNFCQKILLTYCSLEREVDTEDQGYIWYRELPERFHCECGKTSFDLELLKEGLPSLLGRDIKLNDWSYERRYSHTKIESIIQRFYNILNKCKDEESLQKFIQDNPVMLAQFFAKQIFYKPNINGKFFADFAILNAKNELIFVEIERPNLQLFKKSRKEQGYPTADFMHAYEQIRDWQEEYRKFPQSYLDKLSLKIENIMATRWVVIAGRKGREKTEHLQRHLSKQIYDTEFLTYDDLASSLRQISRELP